MIGKDKRGIPFHSISWSSHWSHRKIKSTPAAEILAASEAVDKTALLKEVSSPLLGIQGHRMVIAGSKDKYHELLSKGNTSEKSV